MVYYRIFLSDLFKYHRHTGDSGEQQLPERKERGISGLRVQCKGYKAVDQGWNSVAAKIRPVTRLQQVEPNTNDWVNDAPLV